MKNLMLEIEVSRKGLRPLIIGQPDDHLSDWRGCNFHHIGLPGWKPSRWLPDTKENRSMLRTFFRFMRFSEELKKALRGKTGTFLSDSSEFAPVTVEGNTPFPFTGGRIGTGTTDGTTTVKYRHHDRFGYLDDVTHEAPPGRGLAYEA